MLKGEKLERTDISRVIQDKQNKISIIYYVIGRVRTWIRGRMIMDTICPINPLPPTSSPWP